VFTARVRCPQLRGPLAREVSQAALGLGGGELGEHVGRGDPFDREPAHADVAVGTSDLDEEGSVVHGQSLDGFGAHADVAVAVPGAEEICNPHKGRNLCGTTGGHKRCLPLLARTTRPGCVLRNSPTPAITVRATALIYGGRERVSGGAMNALRRGR